MTLVTATVEDVRGTPDNTMWIFRSLLRESTGGEIITPQAVRVNPVDGLLSVDLEPGFAAVAFRGKEYTIDVPDSGPADLFDLISASIAFAPGTPPNMVAAAVMGWMSTHLVDVWGTLGVTPTGTSLITADSVQEVRTELGVDASLEAWAGADAFIDFTNKPDGDPPSVLDTGQPVDFVFGPSSAKPQMSSGKLVHGTPTGSSTYADYYQAQLDGDCRAFGARWTVNSADGSTASNVCIVAWANIFQTSGVVVPRHAAHISLNTVTGAWYWYVNDGLVDNTHFVIAKSGTFTPPASDGAAVWESAVYLDPDNGIGYLYLPGNDATTGNRYITVTDAEIAAVQTAASIPVRTLAYLMAGTDVVVCEHFANTNANTAIYPRFLDMWGETRRPSRDRGRALRQTAALPAASTSVLYAPTTQQAKALGQSLTSGSLFTDTANSVLATLKASAGPLGKIEFTIPSICFEFVGDTSRVVTDGIATSASTTLTSATAAFTADDVGRKITVAGAGASGGILVTTIASRTSATVVVLSDAASTTVASAGRVRIYTPLEHIIFARLSGTGSVLTTQETIRCRAGERWTGSMAFTATGIPANTPKTWTLQVARFGFPTGAEGSATIKFGGAGQTSYPALRIIATPL